MKDEDVPYSFIEARGSVTGTLEKLILSKKNSTFIGSIIQVSKFYKLENKYKNILLREIQFLIPDI